MRRRRMNTRDSSERGLPCPECGYVLRSRHYILSGTLMTGGPCPECGVTLYRQIVESRFALTKRAAAVVWPACIGLTFFLVDSMEWIEQNVSSWLLVAMPFLVVVTIFGVLIPIFYNRKKLFERNLLATDVGGWSLIKRRCYRYYAYAMIVMYFSWTFAQATLLSEISESMRHVLLLVIFLPGVTMMIAGYPYTDTRTPKSVVAKEIPKDDGWIAVDQE